MKFYITCDGMTIGFFDTDKEQTRLLHNSFYNFGATDNEELHYLNQPESAKPFVYFHTTRRRLNKYLLQSSIAMLVNNENPIKHKGKKFGIIEEARKIAKKRAEDYETVDFLKQANSFTSHCLSEYDYPSFSNHEN